MIKRILIIITTSLLLFTSCGKAETYDKRKLKEGDIIFQETRGRQSRAIKLATHSRYSHVGIIFKYQNNLHVFEAVQPVRITKLNDFINRGVNRHFVIKRLHKSKKYLTIDNLRRMKIFGKKFLGKNYDLYFEWNNDRIYCTELVWKIYHRVLGIKIGKLQKLKDFDLKHSYVKKLMKERYGKNIPYNEPVISPMAMYKSKLLKTVFKVN